jgi:hypothetical protein
MILWDLDHGYAELSSDETAEIYRHSARILTSFYDTETYEEIFPWHHASGDFVVSRHDGNIDVKLITIRQYAPRAVFQEASPENRVTALLVFLANLTIRMRLDRLDGVGEVTWAGEGCVTATIRGFFDALRTKLTTEAGSASVLHAFPRMINRLSLTELADLLHTVAESYDADAADTPIIAVNLVDHVFQVYEGLRSIPAEPAQGNRPS